MIAETSAQGTLMLRECVENADSSEFKCENKLGDQGTVSFFSIMFMLFVFSQTMCVCQLSEERQKTKRPNLSPTILVSHLNLEC